MMARLLIDNINASDLQDTGSYFDPQDPSLQIVIGSQTLTTKRQKDSKTEAKFLETFTVDIDLKDYETLEIQVEVFNESSAGSKKHVGKGKLNLKSAIPKFDIYSDVVFQLSHISGTKETKKGKLMMRCKIEGPSITASRTEVPISTAQSQPVTGLKEESITQKTAPVANFPSKPQEQIVSNSIESKPINSIPPSGEAQPLTLPLNSQDTPLSSSTDTKTITPSSTTIQKSLSKPEIKPSSSELIVQNYEGILQVHIDNLEVSDIQDTGISWDAQDPSLSLFIGKQTFHTKRQKDAKTEAKFPEVFSLSLNSTDYTTQEMKFEVSNESSIGLKKHIGSGQIKLKDEISEFNKNTMIEVALTHNPGSKNALAKGKLKFRVMVEKQLDPSAQKPVPDSSITRALEKEEDDDDDDESELNIIPAADAVKIVDAQPPSRPDVAAGLDANVKLLVVRVEGFHAKDLANTGSFVDKQDPSLTVRIGKKSFETKRVKDAGTEASFPEAFTFLVSAEGFKANIQLEVELFNESLAGSKVHVGKGQKILRELISNFGSLEQYSLPLVHADKKKEIAKGVLSFKCSVEPTLESSASPPSTTALEVESERGSDKSEKGPSIPSQLTLVVSDMEAMDLVDTGSYLDSQDPSLTLTIAEKSFSTARMKDAKTRAKFPEVITFTIDGNSYQSGEHMKVEVFNESATGNKAHIGLGQVVLKNAIPRLDQLTTFIVNLTYRSKKKEEQKGKVVLKGILHSGKIPMATAGPPKIEADSTSASQRESNSVYLLTVKDFYAKDLTNTGGILDSQDPSLTVTVGKSKFSTVRVKDAGSEARFAETFNFRIDRSMYEGNQEIEVEVFNESKSSVKKHVGKGRVVLRSVLPIPEQEEEEAAEFTIKLFHVDNKGVETQKGQLTFRGTIAVLSNEHENHKKVKIQNIRIEKFEIIGWKDATDKVNVNFDCGEKSATATKLKIEGSSLVWSQESEPNILLFSSTDYNMKATVTNINVATADKIASGEVKVLSSENQTATIQMELSNERTKSSCGTLKVTLNFEEVDPFFSFKNGRLLVKRMACRDLKNVEFMGQVDPYVVLKLGSESRQTEPMEEGGSAVTFDLLDIAIDVQRDAIEFDKLKVRVMDKNTTRAHVLIGECTLTLMPLLHRVNEVVEFRSDLSDGKSTSGSIILFLQLMDAASLPADNEIDIVAVDPNFKEGIFQINTVRAFDLKETTALINSTVSNPYLKFKFANWSVRSSYLNSAVHKVPIFENLGLASEVTLDEVLTLPLLVEVAQAKTLGDTSVGVGQCFIRSVAAKVGQECELHVDLSHNNVPSGRLVIFARIIEKPAVVADADYILPDNFKVGVIVVNAIKANNLKNTELMGQQDPYVVLSYGEKWSKKTDEKDNAGSNASWQDLGFSLDLSRDEVLNIPLKVSAFDKNTLSDALIGHGTVLLKKFAANIGNETEIELTIYDDKKKPAGRITLLCVMQYKVEELKLSPGFTQGCLRIDKIVCHSLFSVNMLSSPSPNIVVKFAGWSSVPLKGEGSNPIWEYLKIQSDVFPAEAFQTQIFSVDLIENKKVVGAGKVSNLMAAASQVGQVVTLPIDLFQTAAKKPQPAGTVVVHLTVVDKAVLETEEALKNAEIEKEKVIKKPSIKEGTLFITYLKGSNLANREILGEADPFVILGFGNWVQETKALNNAGGKVIWDGLDFRVDVTGEELQKEKLTVTVMDKNAYRQHSLIGKAEISLERLAYTPGKEVEVEEDVIDKKSKNAGRILVRMEVRERLETKRPTLPEGFTKGILRIFRIRTFELANTELVGLQDPFVVAQLGQDNKTQMKTPTIDNGGPDVLFDFLDFKVVVTAASLQSESLEFQAWDANQTGDTLIGTGKILSLQHICSYGEEVQIPVTLRSKKGDVSGRLLVFVKLEEFQEDIPLEKFMVADGFETGIMSIRRICAFGLLDTEWLKGLTKQDPYAVVSIGNWKDQTKVLQNVGTNAIWEVDMNVNVDRKTCEEGKFEVALRNKGNVDDKLIGSGQVSLRRAASKLDTLTELSMDLRTDKGKAAGRVVLYAELQKEVLDSDWVIDKNFTFGIFKVSKILAFNLKNTEYLGKQDPFVVLSLGSWTEKTHAIDEAGDNACWEYLSMETDMDRQMVESVALDVKVLDENHGRADALIGTGSVSLKSCGAQVDKLVELRVKLVDGEGKSAGRLVISATLNSVQAGGADLPASFEEGLLAVQRIVVSVNKQKSILSSGGSYSARLSLNDFQVTTPPVASAEDNPVWNFLDYKIPCDVKTVKSGQVSIEVISKGTLKDSSLGVSLLDIKRTGSKLGSDVQLVEDLLDRKGVSRGKVFILARLVQGAALSKAVLDLPPGFTAGIVTITGLKAIGLANKELLGKQDPYLRLRIGDWSETTETLPNAGGVVAWPSLTMQAEVNADILSKEKLEIIAMDENSSRDDDILGTGMISLRKLAGMFAQRVELSIDLKDDKGASAGRVTLFATLTNGKLQDLSEGIPDAAVTFKDGKMRLHEVSLLDMESIKGEKEKPIVQLKLDDWSVELPTSSIAKSRSKEWKENETAVEMSVTNDLLLYKKISVSVVQTGVLQNTVVASGDISLRKLGSSQSEQKIENFIRLKDSKGRPAGRMRLVASLKMLDLETASAISALDSTELGQVAIISCQITVLSMNKKAVVSLGCGNDWTNVSPALDFVSAEVNSKKFSINWDANVSTSKMPIALFRQRGVNVSLKPAGGASTSVLGSAHIPLELALAKAGETVTLEEDLKTGTSKKVGKVKLQVKYFSQAMIEKGINNFVDVPLADELSPMKEAPPTQQQQPPRQSSLDLETLKNLETSINTKISQLEGGLQGQLKEELKKEKAEILKAINAQNENLKDTIDSLSQALKTMNDNRPPPPEIGDTEVLPPPKLKVRSAPVEDERIPRVKLPLDVKTWRNAHVLAWLAFRMELPQYMESFSHASIDGLVLTKHVSADTLRNSLDVADELHVQKIMEGINVLQERQKKLDEESELERLQRFRKKKEEEDYARKVLEEQKQLRLAQEKLNQKKLKRQQQELGSKTAPPREHNVVLRKKMERDISHNKPEQFQKSQKDGKKAATWRFEYTGGAPPPAVSSSNIYSAEETVPPGTIGTKSYANIMTLDILDPQKMTATSGLEETINAKPRVDLKEVPVTCTTEELLIAIRGTMFDVSSWLLEVERVNQRKQSVLDKDLESVGNDDIEVMSDQEADNGEQEGENPPTYSELFEGSGDNDTKEEEPPSYSELFGEGNTDNVEEDDLNLAVPAVVAPPAPNSKRTVHYRPEIFRNRDENKGTALHLTDEPARVNRTQLIFDALVGQQNNNARWLGNNSKLTRLKFYGGLSTLLKLQVEWPQFDTLWTKLGNCDLDFQEFKRFFNLDDASDPSDVDGGDLGAKSQRSLLLCMYDLCDQLRYAGFTVAEMLAGFDRNASGFISASEFCSMLKLVLSSGAGPKPVIDKKLIYHALYSVDTDGSKTISLQELSAMIYTVWRMQLDELADKLSRIATTSTGASQRGKEGKEIEQRLLKERADIKDAIKRNFPRQLRDMLEAESRGNGHGHTLVGPFQALFGRLGISQVSEPLTNNNSGSPVSSPVSRNRTTTLAPNESMPYKQPHSPRTLKSSRQNNITGSQSSSAATTRTVNQMGQNQIKRFKIRVAGRPGMALTLPPANELGNDALMLGENTAILLKNATTPYFG